MPAQPFSRAPNTGSALTLSRPLLSASPCSLLTPSPACLAPSFPLPVVPAAATGVQRLHSANIAVPRPLPLPLPAPPSVSAWGRNCWQCCPWPRCAGGRCVGGRPGGRRIAAGCENKQGQSYRTVQRWCMEMHTSLLSYTVLYRTSMHSVHCPSFLHRCQPQRPSFQYEFRQPCADYRYRCTAAAYR